MKKLAVSIILFIIYLFTIPTPVIAGNQEFFLFNKTSFPIQKVYISHISRNNWEEDILGNNVLPSGAATRIRFPSSFGQSRYWDLKVTDKQGNEYILKSIDLIEAAGIALYYQNGRMKSLTVTMDDLRRYNQNR